MAAISLKLSEIEMMRGNLLALNDFVYKNRFNMQQDDGRQLMNHFNYALDILSTMANKVSIQMAAPAGQSLIYDLNNSGRSTIVTPGTLPRTTDGWEQQFDDKLLLNPPCYNLPPQNLSNIQKIRTASTAQRLNTL